MKRLIGCVVFASLIASQVAAAKDNEKPPSDAELAAITTRGRLLARYDQIAWHATDGVESLHRKDGEVQGYIVKFAGDSWIAAFGHLSEDRKSLVLSYQVTTNPKLAGDLGAAHPVNQTDTGDLFHEFLAMDTARTSFGPQTQPYNDAVLPAPNGGYFVYFYPGSTDANVILMGGDYRYLVSADGTTVLEKRQLHASIREDRTNTKEGKADRAFHTHVLSDQPEDTDVMYVLMRHPPIPELIASKKFLYQIDADGTIHYLGETDKVLKQ